MYKRKRNVQSIRKYPQDFLSVLNIDFDSYIRYSLNTSYVYCAVTSHMFIAQVNINSTWA
jgi:hypothetical protein